MVKKIKKDAPGLFDGFDGLIATIAVENGRIKMSKNKEFFTHERFREAIDTMSAQGIEQAEIDERLFKATINYITSMI